VFYWGKIGSKCNILFSGPPKGTSLCETTSFDVLNVKIGAGVLSVGGRKNQKNYPSHLMRIFAYLGGKWGNHIVMKFCIVVGVPNVITLANLGDDRFRGF